MYRFFYLCMILMACFLTSFCQDTLYGNIKTLREKIVFTDTQIQNRKLFSIEGDYGHYGFSSREFTLERFESWWRQTYWTHYLNYARQYDSLGNMLSEEWYDKKDQVIRKYVFVTDTFSKNESMEKEIFRDGEFRLKKAKRNRNGQLVASMETLSDIPGWFVYTYYEYRPDGKLDNYRQFDEDGPGYRKRYEYDVRGRVSKIFASSGFKEERINEKSRVIKRTADIQDFLQEEYQYNDFDSITDKREYARNDDKTGVSLLRRYHYEYDSLKRKSVIFLYTDSLSSVQSFYYDGRGLLMKDSASFLRFNKYERVLTYMYNPDKTVRQLIYTEYGKSTVVRFEYEYDQKQNWTEQRKFVNDRLLYIRKRNITYWR